MGLEEGSRNSALIGRQNPTSSPNPRAPGWSTGRAGEGESRSRLKRSQAMGYAPARGRARARPLVFPGPLPRLPSVEVERAKAPWHVAMKAADAAGVSLEPMHGLEGAERAAALVEALWGPGQLPPFLIRAFDHAGTVILGAESDGQLVGFVLGFPGLDGGLHMHSHMLGVLPDQQSRGIGFALKLGQRAACLDEGVAEVRWTYDPLVARNAWFNLMKLGVEATGLLRSFYGRMDDVINRGDRSDRFEVRWRLESDRVNRTIDGYLPEPAPGPILLEPEGNPDAARPRETGAPPEPGAVVAVPVDYHQLRQRDAALGAAWRDASSRAFEACFGCGLVAAWISRDGRYVFVRPEEAST